VWDWLRAVTDDPDAVAAAAEAARLGRRERAAVAREARKVMGAVGSAERYEALRAFLDVLERGRNAAQRPGPVP
jgi:hypothetical protein